MLIPFLLSGLDLYVAATDSDSWQVLRMRGKVCECPAKQRNRSRKDFHKINRRTPLKNDSTPMPPIIASRIQTAFKLQPIKCRQPNPRHSAMVPQTRPGMACVFPGKCRKHRQMIQMGSRIDIAPTTIKPALKQVKYFSG